MRRAARVDVTQPDIVKALRKIGAEVTYLHVVGQGCPDLLVSFRQRWWVIECKADDGDLTTDQKQWIGRQHAPTYVVRSAEEAVAFLQNVAPDWLLGFEAVAMKARTHICEGPKPGDDIDLPKEPAEPRERLIDRVHEALKASWRAHTKLSENDLCEMLGASKASKRVEKALRALCKEGRANREGNNRNAMYWAESST